MAGLILLAALAVLIALLIWLSGLVTKRLPIPAGWKVLLRVVIVVGAFPLTVADEIIGKQQFENLCRVNGIERADLSIARGKRVVSEYGVRKSVQRTVLPIWEFDVLFRNVENNEVLIRYKNYHAMGGWLTRNTPLSMGGARPILFAGSCTVDYAIRDAIFRQNNVLLVNQGS